MRVVGKIGYIGDIEIGNTDLIQFLYSKEGRVAKIIVKPRGNKMLVERGTTREEGEEVATFEMKAEYSEND